MLTTRILHCVIGNMNVGGIETMLMVLYRNIDRTKFQFDFVVHSEEENYYEKEICHLGGKLYRIPFISKHPFKHYIKFRRLLQTHPEYQIIHIHTTYSIMYFDAKIAKHLGRIVIVHSHNSKASKKHILVHKIFKNKLSQIADYRLSCSRIAAKWMFQPELIGTVEIWKNAIYVDKFLFNKTKRDEIRSLKNVQNQLVIGSVGRLSYQKNQTLLLRIFKQVVKLRKDAILWLIGDGEDRIMLEHKVKEWNLSDKVIFWGTKKNVADYMMAFDMLVLTSRWEGLGIVMIEAQATGLPIIAPSHIDEMVKITEGVHIVESYENITQWVNTIIQASSSIIDRKKQYHLVKKAGFDIHSQVEIVEKFYNRINPKKNIYNSE